MFAGKGQQLTHEFGRALAGARDLLERFACVRPEVGLGAEEADVALDHGEDIVEIMSHTCCQPAERVHFLGVVQLRLQA